MGRVEVERVVVEVELAVVVDWRRRRLRGDGGGGASDFSWRRGGIRRRGALEEEAPHVDGEQAAAVAAPHRYRLEQAARRHAHLHRTHAHASAGCLVKSSTSGDRAACL